jgi:hypothetical protein
MPRLHGLCGVRIRLQSDLQLPVLLTTTRPVMLTLRISCLAFVVLGTSAAAAQPERATTSPNPEAPDSVHDSGKPARPPRLQLAALEGGYAALVGSNGQWVGASYSIQWALSTSWAFRAQPVLLAAWVKGEDYVDEESQMTALLVRGMFGHSVWSGGRASVGLFTGLARTTTDAKHCARSPDAAPATESATFTGVPGGLSLDWAFHPADGAGVEVGVHVDWGELPVPSCDKTLKDPRRPFIQLNDTSGLFGLRLAYGWR